MDMVGSQRLFGAEDSISEVTPTASFHLPFLVILFCFIFPFHKEDNFPGDQLRVCFVLQNDFLFLGLLFTLSLPLKAGHRGW